MDGIPVSSALVISDTLKIFSSMLDDMEKAVKYIYLETYKFENGPIGIKFRDTLIQKAREGVKIKLLIDAWGSAVGDSFFKTLISLGGEVKFFRKVKFSINTFTLSHERDHRKLLIIDDEIVYISSLNITNYCINWRELSLRVTGRITKAFKTIFIHNYNLKNTYKFNKKRHTRIFRIQDYEIIRDVPSVIFQRLRKKFLHMIKQAQSRIIIETPYFLPTRAIRDALVKAARERGVKIIVAMPARSDVRLINILKDFYLGRMFQAGVEIFFYEPHNLHAKMLVVDYSYYIGTSNFDYRSFRYQFEVGLLGKDRNILTQLLKHNEETLQHCYRFDYEKWRKRRFSQKVVEVLLVPLRHFL